MVLMVGATGRLGREICRALAMKGIPIRAMIREMADRQKVELLKKYGSTFAYGDLREPRSLEEACQGVHHVICSASALSSYDPGVNDFETVDLQGVKALIDVAAESGAEHFIYISFSLRNEFDSPLMQAKQAIEKHLANSGMTYSILHPSFMMETWFSPEMGFDLESRSAVLFGDGKNPIPWISNWDTAKAAVDVLTNPSAYNAVVDLRGPNSMSQLEVIQILENKIHCSLKKVFWPEEFLFIKHHEASDPLEKTLFSLFLACASGKPIFPFSPNSDCINGSVTVGSFIQSLLIPALSSEIPSPTHHLAV